MKTGLGFLWLPPCPPAAGAGSYVPYGGAPYGAEAQAAAYGGAPRSPYGSYGAEWGAQIAQTLRQAPRILQIT